MCGCDENQCGTGGCKSGCGCDAGKGCGSKGSGCDMTDMVMSIADDAWEELMMEKMKAELEKRRGAQMSKIAAAAVEASLAHWAQKKESEAKLSEQQDKLQQALRS